MMHMIIRLQYVIHLEQHIMVPPSLLVHRMLELVMGLVPLIESCSSPKKEV